MSLLSKYFSINPEAVASNYREWIRLLHGLLLVVGTLSPLLSFFHLSTPEQIPMIFVFTLILMPISYLISKILLNLYFGIIYVFLNLADDSRKTAKELQHIRIKRFPSE